MIAAVYYTTPMCGIRNLVVAGRDRVEHIPWTDSMDFFVCM
jgi:hypothetical protein